MHTGSVKSFSSWTVKGLFLWGLFLVVLAFSFRVSHLDMRTLFEGYSFSVSLVREMFPPDFSRWNKIALLSMETIAMGFWGTIIGMLFSFPLGFLAAKNTSGNRVVYTASRHFVNLLR